MLMNDYSVLNDGIYTLKQWLKAEDRSKSYLARKCNVSPAAVHYWFERKFEPKQKHKDIIKELTGVEL